MSLSDSPCLGSLYSGLPEILLGSGQHQFDTVQLVYFTGTRIVINGYDIGLRILSAQFLDYAFSYNMVGKTAKWLGADNIGSAAVD